MSDDAIRAIYREGTRFPEYLAAVRANAERFQQIHRRFEFVAFDASSSIFAAGTRVLVFCEPYCADCVINLPLIARLVDASPDTELRVVSRDRHRAVAERFPGRGGISRLPTVVLLDREWTAFGYWSERARSDHEWMSNFTRSDPIPEITVANGLPTGDFARWLERRFASQLPLFYEQHWQEVRDELRALARVSYARRPR
ncbi:hypothetical protein GCM10011487_55930 [Steroidobacter agaridevorans]|uniref:Thioredoxin family protein n=1 Tax=Steroidobacter agaridevorans TaxID=2695856 RepID=A0A829YL65_9GAMM|nr:thioredoxin family protein [Steroidobacter agaridevorans]GFE83593.1 hypothetical protein GCM10011487_55930 [Steroidobacter agaridevorans]GFE86525.1 hypothetical protein GCM10011488_14790 [Steroidobacter agaridevorans]